MPLRCLARHRRHPPVSGGSAKRVDLLELGGSDYGGHQRKAGPVRLLRRPPDGSAFVTDGPSAPPGGKPQRRWKVPYRCDVGWLRCHHAVGGWAAPLRNGRISRAPKGRR